MKHTQIPVRSLAVMAAAAVLMMPLLAMAQSAPTPADFEPTANDLTGYMLRSIFGDWAGGGEAPLLGPAMRVLNLFALTFGTLMFTYVAVIGTLNTAQDGEILGRKWSSMWVPLRFVFGTALLVPLSTGYSTIQHLILWLALVGGGGASQVWGAAVEGFVSEDGAAVMAQGSEDFRNKVKGLMRDVLKAETCTAYLSKPYPGSFGMTGPIPVEPPRGMNPETTFVAGFKYQWGAVVDGTSGKGVEECGSMVTTSFTETKAANGDLSLAYSTPEESAGLPDVDKQAVMQDAYKAMVVSQVEGIAAARAILAPLARELAATATPGSSSTSVTAEQINRALDNATRAYIRTSQPGRRQVGLGADASLTKFIAASKDSGWLMAGSSFFQLGRIKSSASAAALAIPDFTPRNSWEAQGGSTPYGIGEAPLYEDLKAADERITTSFSDGSTEGLSYFADFGKNFSMTLGRVFGVDPSNEKHALAQIKDTGDTLLWGIEGLAAGTLASYTGVVSAEKIGGAIPFAGAIPAVVKDVFTALIPALYAAFIAMFGVAITMSFLLPMLPFMLSIGSILGWLMAVFSAMVAAPVWLAGHLHPEGDGFAGKGVGGYMILLETVTRPIFIVFGLIGAFVIMDPMLKFVAWAFRANLSAIQGNSITGIVSIVMFAGIYVAIVWTVVRQSLQLIFALSEKVYTWIGGANAGYEQAREFGGAAQSNTASVGRAIQGVGGVVTASVGEARKRRAKAADMNPSDSDTGVERPRSSSEGRSS